MARRSLAIVVALLLLLATATVAFAEDTATEDTATEEVPTEEAATEEAVSEPLITLDPAVIEEGTVVGTVVGLLTIDGAPTTLLYSLVAGEGDTHNHLFVVEGDAVLTATEVDYETLGADLTIRIAAADAAGELVLEHGVGITLTDMGEISLVPSDIDENVEAGSYIGTLHVEGAVEGATFGYGLVPGEGDAHNHLFTIEDADLLTADELDFEELGPSLSIRVAATDLVTGEVVHEHRLFVVLNDFEAEMTAAEQEILDALHPVCDPRGDEFVLWRFPQLDDGTDFSYTFGADREGGERRHRGADLMGAAKGMPVVAVADGLVSYVGTGEKAGHFVMIQHEDGWETRYMHLNNDTFGTDDGVLTREEALAPGITVGAVVVAGQLLGWVGDSGNAENSPPHTHFELWQYNHLADPFACLRQAWDWQLLVWDLDDRIR